MPLHEHFPEGHVQAVAKVWNFVQPFKIVTGVLFVTCLGSEYQKILFAQQTGHYFLPFFLHLRSY